MKLQSSAEYARFSDTDLTAWLAVSELSRDVVLAIKGDDVFDAHTAIRHIGGIDLRSHAVTVMLPPALRKHPGFTPWLHDASTVRKRDLVKWPEAKAQTVNVLRFVAKARHVHSSPSNHHASFDVRVGGQAVRTLFDTGANCSCMSQSFASQVGLTVTHDMPETERIGGVGGQVVILGHVTCPVKIGKYQADQRFAVVKQPIAGYECLLGEDFMQVNACGIIYTPISVSVQVGLDASEQCMAKLTRRLDRSIPSELKHGHSTAGVLPVALTIGNYPTEEGPASHSERRKLLKEVEQGKACAYRVLITPAQTVAVTGDAPIHESVQRIIDKHSVPGGTLCGTIPPHTHAKGYSCHIELVQGAHPVHIRQYRLTPLEREELMKQVDAFIDKGWIEPSTSSWCSSVLFVPKPNNKLRFCVDFRQVNQKTVVDGGCIPLQGELLDRLQGANYFSALDLASGYYQLAMAPESREITAFPTPYGLYQWRVMPMGLCNAPAVFQRAMNQILWEHIKAGYCMVYLDDIIIMSKSVGEHARHVDAVLSSLHAHNLFCQLPKCFWARSELKYLGHIVSGEGVKPDPAKVAALENWRPPLAQVEALKTAQSIAAASAARKQIVHECRRFLGFMNYFNRFIPRYAELATCLHTQTSNEAPEWSDECTAAWEAMKSVLCKATLMYHPDFNKPFHVYFDASIRAVGGVIMQERDGVLVPVSYCARKLSTAEVNYTTTEQEMLAMVYCFMQWRCYLEGSAVFLHTDHEPLTWLASQAKPNRRQARWLEFLSRFQYKLLYVKGDRNVVADALTRMLSIGPAVLTDLPGESWPHVVTTFACRRRKAGASSSCAGAGDAPHGVPSQHRVPDGCASRGGGRPQGGLHPSGLAGQPHGARTRTAASTGPRRTILTVTRFAGVGGWTRSKLVGNSRTGTAAQSCAGEAHQRAGMRNDAPATCDSEMLAEDSYVNSDTVRRRVTFRESDVHVPARGGRRQSKNGKGNVRRDVHGPAVPPEVSTADPGNAETTSNVAEASPDGLDQPQDGGEANDGVDPSLSQYERIFDELFDRIRKSLLSDAATQSEQQRTSLHLTERDQLYWRDHLLYIPDDTDLIHDILYWHHDVPWCAHLGIEKTLDLVRQQFFWPGMTRDIREYIRTCYKCQANKTDRRPSRPPLSPLVSPSACWRVLGVDMIMDLPVTAGNEYNAIVVFVCHLSKMVRLVPARTSLTTEGFAKLFVREVFPHYGMPETIVSDRGTQWNSEFFHSLCERLNIKLKLSTAYHPQTNGLVERTNEVVEAALRHFVAADHRDWDEFLPFIEFALNSSYHQSIQSTPFRMNRISLPRNPFDAVMGRVPVMSELTSTMGVSTAEGVAGIRTVVQAQEQFAWARRCVHLAKSRMKETHDKKALNLNMYEPGQLVWFSMKHIALRHPSMRHKLVPRYVGPLKILECVGRNAVRLDMPESLKVHPTVSVSLVKPYVARAGESAPPVVINGIDEFEVRAITNHKVLQSRSKKGLNLVEFQIEWKGNYEPTWQTFMDCEHSLDTVEQYLRSSCTKAARLKIYKVLKPEELLLLQSDLRAEAAKPRD